MLDARTFLFAGGLVCLSCGDATRLDVDKVEAALRSPTGLTTDTAAVQAVVEAARDHGVGAVLARSGLPGLAFGTLRAEGVPSGLSLPFELIGAELASWRGRVATWRGALQSAPVEACLGGPDVESELQDAFLDLLEAGEGESRTFFSVDLAACPETTLTGVVDFRVAVELTRESFGGTMRVSIVEQLISVCEPSGRCSWGRVFVELTSDAGTGPDALRSLGGWDLDVRYPNGAESTSRGGVRLEGATPTERLVTVHFIPIGLNRERSYVVESTETDAGRTVDVRGRDGALSCELAEDGSGACSGPNPISIDAL